LKWPLNRKYFTKHGLHLNNAGKERFAKLTATQIDKLINNINPLNAELNPICCLLALIGAQHILHGSRIRVNRNETVIALNWKEETTNKSTNVTDNYAQLADN